MMPTDFNWLAGLDVFLWTFAIALYATALWTLWQTIEKGEDDERWRDDDGT
jgi:hypothetical protein